MADGEYRRLARARPGRDWSVGCQPNFRMVAGAGARDRHDLDQPAALTYTSTITHPKTKEVILQMILRGIQNTRDRRRRERAGIDDLSTQLESLLDLVWRRERTWNLEDRIEYLIKAEGEQRRR